MFEVYERLFIGTDLDCTNGTEDQVVAHACKHPCHVRAVGYRGSLPREHPNYLVLEREYDLYLNMIDPERPLFMPPLFSSFLAFAAGHWDAGRKVMIHCNQGESRAPTLALLLLAKHLKAIPNDSFADASREFTALYPSYRPGRGINAYVTQYWSAL